MPKKRVRLDLGTMALRNAPRTEVSIEAITDRARKRVSADERVGANASEMVSSCAGTR